MYVEKKEFFGKKKVRQNKQFSLVKSHTKKNRAFTDRDAIVCNNM